VFAALEKYVHILLDSHLDNGYNEFTHLRNDDAQKKTTVKPSVFHARTDLCQISS